MTIRPTMTHRTRFTTTLLAASCCVPMLFAGCNSPAERRNEGILAMNRGQNQLAVLKLTESVETAPRSALSRYHLGRAYLAVNENIKAQYELEKAYALRPNHSELTPDILDELAEALFRQDEMSSLFAFLDEHTEGIASTRDFLRQGKYLAKAGDPDAARLAFRKAAYFAEPNDVEPYLAIADFYIAIGDQPNALLALRYGNHVAPGNLEVAERLRQFGIVPGPTVAEAPPKPALLR